MNGSRQVLDCMVAGGQVIHGGRGGFMLTLAGLGGIKCPRLLGLGRPIVRIPFMRLEVVGG